MGVSWLDQRRRSQCSAVQCGPEGDQTEFGHGKILDFMDCHVRVAVLKARE